MPTNRWTRVDAIFARALTLPLDEREEYVRRACDGDESLRREVDELLGAAGAADEFFEDLTPPGRLDPEALAPEPTLESGHQVGAYRVVRLLGEGGMGAVYLAERADGQFEQRVAIKVVQRTRGTARDLIRRFVQERQILARLHHPGIARLYDGGVTADGRPFLVMEYVEGEPITDWCEVRKLTVAARVRLFQRVGRAVQHAHRNLVIHRDLKPSNILVTAEGEVKLLDFGIAKLVEENEDAAVTRTGGSLMTPAYAAPEQVRGEAVTTATDIYALGVLLYELLTGRRPYGASEATPHEVARAVLEEPPTAPSAVVDRVDEAADEDAAGGPPGESVARARGTRPDRLRRLLAGDLDRICLMALRKEPDRRYGSAQALVDDLGRHLEGHPVAARPDTVGYRTRKFVTRHRTGVIAAGIILVSLVGGLGAALWQAGIASREAAKAREVSDFVLGLFEVSDPDETLAAGDLSVRELLRRGADRIETELAGQPALKAEMYSVVGPIFRRLGLYDDARPLLESAVELRRETAGGESPEHAGAVQELGRLELVTGNIARADSLFEAAIGWYERAPGSSDLALARLTLDRADVAKAENRNEDARALYRAARDALAAAGADPTEVILADLDLGESLHVLGEEAAADSVFATVVERRDELPAERSLALARTLMLVGQRAAYGGDVERAEPMFRDAIELRRTALGDRHREVALGLSELSGVLWARGEHDEALRLHREAVDILREAVGPEHPEYAMILGALAVKLTWAGDLEDALERFRETERIQAGTLGEEHFHLAMTRRNLGRTLMALDRYDEALPKLEAALEGWLASQGDQDFFTGPTRLDLARVRLRLGDRAGADSLVDALLARYAEAPPRGTALADALVLDARIRAEGGDRVAAIRIVRGAIDRYEEQGLPLDGIHLHDSGAGAQRLLAEVALGEFLLEDGRYAEAEPHLLAGLEGFETTRGATNREAANVRSLLERLYRAWGRPSEAARFAGTGS